MISWNVLTCFIKCEITAQTLKPYWKNNVGNFLTYNQYRSECETIGCDHCDRYPRDREGAENYTTTVATTTSTTASTTLSTTSQVTTSTTTTTAIRESTTAHGLQEYFSTHPFTQSGEPRATTPFLSYGNSKRFRVWTSDYVHKNSESELDTTFAVIRVPLK